MAQSLTKKRGFSTVEIMLAISIFAIFTIGLLYLSIDTIQRDSRINLNTESLLYAQEGIEAARSIADKNYLLLTNGDHGLYINGGDWDFVPAPEDIDGFYERTITVEDVYRNESGDIDEAGTQYDPDIKKVTSEVSWLQAGIIPKTTSLTTYIANWKGDDVIQTTCTEINEGTFDNTDTTPLPSPPSDNCGIKLFEIEVGSDFFSTVNLGKHANDVDIDGNYAYLASSDEGEGFSIADISDIENPSIIANLDVTGKGRYVRKSGNYAYLGVARANSGLAIVNVSNPNSPSLSTSEDIGEIGNQPDTFDNNLYMAVNAENESFLVYDISDKSSPILLDSIQFNDEVYVIQINGNYAYLGLDDDNLGFRVVDISDPNNVSQIASLNVGEEVNAIEIQGNIAFLGTEDTADSLQVVNISDPSNPTIITSINVNGEIQDLTITGDYLYAAVDEANAGLAAINISNPYSPYLAYNLDILGKGTGIDSDTNYVYISTDVSNRGLVIVGVTVLEMMMNGTYESPTFDTGSNDTRYNFIEWDHTEVPSGSVKFQIRTASTTGNIGSATWVGHDGTNATYYENSRTAITLDPGASGSRYFQYKAYLDSDGVTTPVINSVKINYTP